MADFTLSDVEVIAVSICKGPANRKRIYLKKHEGSEPLITLPSRHNLIRKADGNSWRVFYTVVAEPGWEEGSGVGDGAIPGATDVWASEDEILKASHSFMRSGGLINMQHKDLQPVGRVVENFIAPADFEITTPDGSAEKILKGSWVVGIEPNDDMRMLIDTGGMDGVSYEGVGVRTPVSKSDADKPATHRSCKKCGAKMGRTAATCKSCGAAYMRKAATLVHEPTVPPGGPGLFGMKGKQLPAYIQHVFNDLVQKGHPHTGRTYALAIGIVKNWARGSDGKGGKVNADTQAKAVAAIAEWEKLKAQARADNVKKSVVSEEKAMPSLLAKIAEKLGIETDLVELTAEEHALLQGINTDEEEEVPLTEDQQAALAKVEGIETQVTDLVKEDGRLAAIEASIQTLLSRIPEPEQIKTDEERRAEIETTVEELAKSLQKAQEDLDTLAQGSSSQDDGDGPRKDLKKNDPDAALAHALLS